MNHECVSFQLCGQKPAWRTYGNTESGDTESKTAGVMKAGFFFFSPSGNIWKTQWPQHRNTHSKLYDTAVDLFLYYILSVFKVSVLSTMSCDFGLKLMHNVHQNISCQIHLGLYEFIVCMSYSHIWNISTDLLCRNFITYQQHEFRFTQFSQVFHSSFKTLLQILCKCCQFTSY